MKRIRAFDLFPAHQHFKRALALDLGRGNYATYLQYISLAPPPLTERPPHTSRDASRQPCK